MGDFSPTFKPYNFGFGIAQDIANLEQRLETAEYLCMGGHHVALPLLNVLARLVS